MTSTNSLHRKVGAFFGVVVSLALLSTLQACARPKPAADLPRLFASEPFDASMPGAFDIDPSSKYALIESELLAHDNGVEIREVDE